MPDAAPAPEPPLTGGSWRTDLFDISEYLRTIGTEPGAPGFDLLARLHSAHVRTFPFCNIDVLMGTHPGVTPDLVQDRLVRRRRGGYCFEHAQIFAGALEHLGFSVRRALGRVHSPHNTRTHTTVVAHVDGRRWLCDPGFGFSLTEPIVLEDGASRMEGDRELRVERRDDAGSPQWVLVRDGTPEHYSDEVTVHPADVRAGHLVTSTPGFGPFAERLMVMRHMPYGHVTITENARTVRTVGEPTEHREISVDEVLDGVRELGVELEPGEDERLAEVVRRIR